MDESYLDVNARIGIMLMLRGFLCPWSSHDSHKAGYELMPTACCCISRLSGPVVELLDALVLRPTRPVPELRVSDADFGPWSSTSMLGPDCPELIPIYINGNLFMQAKAVVLTFIKRVLGIKSRMGLRYPECVLSMVIGTHQHPGVWVTSCSGRLLLIFSVPGIG